MRLQLCAVALLGAAAALPLASAQTTRSRNYVYRFFGGQGDDAAKGQATDAAGNTYLVGDFRTPTLGFGGIARLTNAATTTTKGSADVFVAKVNANGEASWAVGWGGAADDNAGAVALDPAGGRLFVGGSFMSANLKFNDADNGKIVKMDPWAEGGANAFVVAVDTATGKPLKSLQIGEGDRDVRITAMVVDGPRNRLLVAGHFNSFLLAPPGGPPDSDESFMLNTAVYGDTGDAFVLAYDLDTWALVGGGQLGGEGDDFVTDMTVDPTTGAVYLAGTFASSDFGLADMSPPRLSAPSGTAAGFVLRLTPELDEVLWARSTGKKSTVTALVADAAGGALYVSGAFTSQVLAGVGPPTATTLDTSLARLEASTGYPTWAATLPAPQDMVLDASKGQLLVFGGFSGSVALAPGLSLRATKGTADVYVARIDAATGTAVGAQSYGKGTTLNARFLAVGITLDSGIDAMVLSGCYTDGGLAVSGVSPLPAEPSNTQHALDVFIARTPLPAQTLATPKAPITDKAAALAPLTHYGLALAGSGDEVVRGVAVDYDGAAYVVGDFSSSVATLGGTRKVVNAGKSGKDIFIAKVRRGGQVEWAYSWGGEGEDTAAAIALDPNGEGFYVAGNFKSASLALGDSMTLTRLAAVLDDDDWANYGNVGGGGFDDEYMDDEYVWEDDDSASTAESGGGLLSNLGGGSTSAAPTDFNSFVAKVDGRGEVVWAKMIGEKEGDDTVTALVATEDAVYFTGAFTSEWATVGDESYVVNSAELGGDTADVFWAAMDAETGATFGAVSFNNVGQDAATDIVVDMDADPEDYPALLVAGSYDEGQLNVVNMDTQEGDLWLPAPAAGKTAAFLVMNGGRGPDHGGVSWAKGFGSNSVITRLALDGHDEAVYAVGAFPALASGGAIPTLVRLDLQTGDVVWSRVLPRPADVVADMMGSLYVTGLFTRTLSVSPTASVTTSNNLNGDLYVAQFDAHDGAGVKVTAHGTSGRYIAQDLGIDSDGALFLAGSYQGNALGLAPGSTLPSPGFVPTPPDGFVGRVWLPIVPTAAPTLAPTRLPTSMPTKAPQVPTPSPTLAATPPPTLAATAAATSSVEPLSVPNDDGAAAGAKDTTDVTTTPEAPASSSSSSGSSSAPQQQLPTVFEPKEAPLDSGAVSNAPQTIDVLVTYAGDAAKVGALEQALLAMVRPYAFSFKAGTAAPTPPRPMRKQRHRRQQRAMATTTSAATATVDACSDPSVPKLDVPLRLTARNATAAAAILAELQQMNGGKHEPLVRGSDVFDASVICGVAYSQALPSGPSPILSPAAMASLEEVKPEPIVESAPLPALPVEEEEEEEEEEEQQQPEEKQATTTTVTPPAAVEEEEEEGEKAMKEEDAVWWEEEGETQAAPDEEGSGSTSGGAIGGAVVGVLLAVGVAAAGVVYVRRRRRAANQFMVA